MKRTKIVSTLLFFAFSLFSLPVYAQQLQQSVESLTKKSDIIITGKVTKKEPKWDKNRSMIFTDVTVEVEEYLKGNENSSSLIINQLGGELDGVGEMYTHMPRFYQEEEVLVFLKKNKKSGKLQTVDGETGKITITEKPKTKTGYSVNRNKIEEIKATIKKNRTN